LKGAIEFPDGLLFVDAFIALEALDDRIVGRRDRMRKGGLSASRRPFDDNWLLHPACEVDDLQRNRVDYILRRIQAPSQLVEGWKHRFPLARF
jgi:hypothetical protein